MKAQVEHIKDAVRDTIEVRRTVECGDGVSGKIVSGPRGLCITGEILIVDVDDLRQFAKIIADSWKDRTFFSEQLRKEILS